MSGNLTEMLSEVNQALDTIGLDAEPHGGLRGLFSVAFAVGYVVLVTPRYPHLIAGAPFLFGFAIAEVLPKSRQPLVTALRKTAFVYMLISPIIGLLLLSWGL